MNGLLVKNGAPSEFTDLAIGEAHMAREALFKALGHNSSFRVDLEQNRAAEYQEPAGYEPLRRLLEEKHKAPVVITNGAKQGLAALFSVLRKLGKERVGIRCPYWSLLAPLIDANGMQMICPNTGRYDAYLAVLPDNPSGFMMEPSYCQELGSHHKDFGIPFIHDAVYYSPIYLPRQNSFPAFGDVQIFSASKSYGLSGLRCGWLVCHNESYYKPLQEYIEMKTVGASTASQDIVYQLLCEFGKDKEKETRFIREAQNKLYIAKSIIKNVKRSILEVPEDIIGMPGMFLFCRANKAAFDKAKISVADGKHFGVDGHIRINLGVPTETMIEVVERLNNV